MAVQNETNRIFLRGDTAKFIVHFYEDAGLTIPVIPIDSARYPVYSIFDCHNEVVQTGIGIAEITAGRYRAELIVSYDAPLSHDKNRWRIEWTIISTDNRQIDFVEEFDIKDTVITASETREMKFITIIGNPYRALLRLPTAAFDVAIDVYRTGNFSMKTVDNINISMVNGVQIAPDGDSIVYYYDIDASALGGSSSGSCGQSFNGQSNYDIVWKIRNTAVEPQEFVYQSLTVITPKTLMMITCLRMLIDKLQKRMGTVQSLEDSDLVEYLFRGAELVNAHYPTTYFAPQTMPQALTVHHLLYSGWYGLQAQGLLSTELGFSFSGQTVTLEYDQSAGLADIAGRWQEFLNTTLAPAKMALVRRNSPVGTVAGRQYRITDINLFTFRVSSMQGGTNQILSQMTTLGLLF